MSRKESRVSTGASRPENGEIFKIAQDAVQQAKYSFVSAAANMTKKARPDSLEAVFQEAITKMEDSKRARMESKAKQLAKLPEPARIALFGRHGLMDGEAYFASGFGKAEPISVDPRLLGSKSDKIKVPRSAKARVTSDGILLSKESLPEGWEKFGRGTRKAGDEPGAEEAGDFEKLQDVWGPDAFQAPDDLGSGALQDYEEQRSLAAAASLYKVAFKISHVKCVDETNPEKFGSDEIAIAGVAVDETGDTEKIAERRVRKEGFDDGEMQWYIPWWSYHSFALTEGEHWPKTYVMTLILAEKDHGGLSSAMSTVWSHMQGYVNAQIRAAVISAGTSVLGPVISAAIAKAAVWVVDRLVSWIISALEDDIFPPYTAILTHYGYDARFSGGSPVSPPIYAHFYGHGGHYWVRCQWVLY